MKQVTVSSHSHTHQVLSLMPEKCIIKELERSKATIEEILNTKVHSICFPEGKFSKQVIDLANKLAYKKQYSSIPGFLSLAQYPTVLHRSLVQFAAEKEFKAILRGGDNILSLWYKMKHFIK